MRRATQSRTNLTPGAAIRITPLPKAPGQLGNLLWLAYQGTIDDEGESLEQWIDEATQTLQGKYGEVIWDSSFSAFHNDQLVSVSLVSDYRQLRPLLSFAATVPDFRGRGIAGSLITFSLDALFRKEIPYLHLVVTDGNPAKLLYDKLGFVEQYRRQPETRPNPETGPDCAINSC